MDFEKITSRDNQRLKEARKVRDGKSADHIFVEGLRLAEEVMRSQIKPVVCFISSGFVVEGRRRELLASIQRTGAAIFELSETAFASIADTENPQGVVVIGERPASSSDELVARIRMGWLNPVIIALQEINNPSNLGAIARTAEASGVAGLVVTKGSADIFSPKALRASMGSAFRLPVWAKPELPDVIEWAVGQKMIVSAAAGSAERSYLEVDWRHPRLLVFGSEAHGLSDTDRHRIQEEIRIPMENGVESLNIAVAAGVLLFESLRQNRAVANSGSDR